MIRILTERRGVSLRAAVQAARAEPSRRFFWTHRTRPPAVQMDEVIAVERKGVVRGNGLLAPPALRLSFLSHRRSWRSSSLLATPKPSRKIATLRKIR